MASSRFSSVEDYLAALDPSKATTIRSVVAFVVTEFPELKSKIAWNVPAIHRDGKYVAGIAAYKNHLTFSPFSTQVIDDFRVRLANFTVFKGTFQIPVDWQIDTELLKDIVRARLAELD
jgi:uncharacterized protein YdhG (YjbR/CyaY superfamily)